MGTIKEPKNVDLSTKSEPWSEKELVEFRELMKQIKEKKSVREKRSMKSKLITKST